MITIVVAGRNDDYGGDFAARALRTARQNAAGLQAAGVEFEYLLAEWNPLPSRAPLSLEFVRKVPCARAVIIPNRIHEVYSLNPAMPFHEMAAKNAAIRRAEGDPVLVTNSDILLGPEVVEKIAQNHWSSEVLYRAHRIDVRSSLSREEMQDPANQLCSGEGALPPPYYLGAGGDFCLAARSLWYSLRGFDERIRFTTRAKDWQLYLSAAAKGIGIEFLGNIYHLDHEGGFRNTPAAELKNESIHFGKWWDFEFGLPNINPDEWGFHGLRERPLPEDPRVLMLEANEYRISEDRDRIDRKLRCWLTGPAGSVDVPSALLYHTICGAHREGRRLICRIKENRTCVALSGMEAVAAESSVPIFCSRRWPDLPGFSLRPFQPVPELREGDWILEESGQRFELTQYGSRRTFSALPGVDLIREPEFNPLLGRRLLRAVLRLQRMGVRRIALYGAGGHTESLLRWGFPDGIEAVAIVVSGEPGGECDGRPVVGFQDLEPLGVEALLLSSCSFEPEMMVRARLEGIPNVLPLYSDWPKDFWRIPDDRAEMILLGAETQ